MYNVSYSKYFWASAVFTACAMLIVVFVIKITELGFEHGESWLLFLFVLGLELLAWKMLDIMRSPLDGMQTLTNVLVEGEKEEKVSLPAPPFSYSFFDEAAYIAGNHSCDIRNQNSWIRVYFAILNRTLNSPPFPRWV